MKCIFVLSTGRSGTHNLYRLCRRNLQDAVCRHEPYLPLANPHLFGAAIDAHQRRDEPFLRRLLEQKRTYVSGLRCSTYVETSHAFLKSYYELAPEYFDDIGLFYLVRDPLPTALSEANRERFLHRVHFPWRNYYGADGRSYFRWSLTGREPIYAPFQDAPLTLFQRYLIQWIEIQNRAVDFLDRFQKHDDCVCLDSPRELNDSQRLQAGFARLGLALRSSQVELDGGHNRTPGTPTLVTGQELDQAEAVFERLPQKYLAIFRRPLFARFGWTKRLLGSACSAA